MDIRHRSVQNSGRIICLLSKCLSRPDPKQEAGFHNFTMWSIHLISPGRPSVRVSVQSFSEMMLTWSSAVKPFPCCYITWSRITPWTYTPGTGPVPLFIPIYSPVVRRPVSGSRILIIMFVPEFVYLILSYHLLILLPFIWINKLGCGTSCINTMCQYSAHGFTVTLALLVPFIHCGTA